jgi:small-conductance mechanosensitive channel
LLIILNLPATLVFLYVFLVSALAVSLYCRGLVRDSRNGNGKAEEVFRKSWGILPAIILIAGLAGFDHLAVFFFFVTLSSIVSILMIWMMFRFHESLLELVLSLVPVAAIREHQAIILGKSRPILFWAHGLLMLAVLAVVWTFYPNVNAAIAGINGFGFTIGDIRLSPGFLVLVMLIFYIGLLVSEISQYVLVRGVLPRYTTELGVRVSIARLAHYVIISLTILIMLRVLGFRLAQLAILGGALGVGIGFGLQAIVNNFASGLILLFERPIKVGDTIRFGNDTGEVREVGLRATIIRTYDNAEIVVPNSMLITSQVTNWTLANRRARLKVPVSAAYGSDVAKVMEILLSCAKEHPGVLSDPKPTVFFLAFAASSLDFELRVWLPDYLHSTGVLSELNIEIESRFCEAGIEMPFPQNDLHLRSMDESVAGQLRGLRGKIATQEDER